MEAMLTEDDISIVCEAMEDSSEDILKIYRVKKDELYERAEKELKEIQQVIHSVHVVPTTPSSS
jgi:hypothetical protein